MFAKLKSPYSINVLVKGSHSLFYHYIALHPELYATLKYIYQIFHLQGKSRKRAWGFCLYSKALRLEKSINITEESKAIGTIPWQKRKMHGDRMKWWCLFIVPLLWKEQKHETLDLEWTLDILVNTHIFSLLQYKTGSIFCSLSLKAKLHLFAFQHW